jgi:hypothetical protein
MCYLFVFVSANSKFPEMVPVGDFHIVYGNKSSAGQQIFVPRSNSSIIWPGNKGPPKDSPECGFHGELCPVPLDDGKFKHCRKLNPFQSLVMGICRIFFYI